MTGWSLGQIEYYDGYGAGGGDGSCCASSPRSQPAWTRARSAAGATLHAVSRLYGGMNAQAIAAIENACLTSRQGTASVYALFGGPFMTAFRSTGRIAAAGCGARPVRGQVGLPPIRSLDDVRQVGHDVVARGFKALKTNPCDLLPGWTSSAPASRHAGFLDRRPDNRSSAIAQCWKVHDGIGPETGMMLDLNFNQRTDGLSDRGR